MVFDALIIILSKECYEIIVPANTCIATKISENLKPIFVEPITESFNIDPEKIENNITDNESYFGGTSL